MHARVHARVGDRRGQTAQRCAEHRNRSCYRPRERERRRRVARRERRGGRHRYVALIRDPRRLAVRALPSARQLHRQVHHGRVDAHRDEPCRRCPSPSGSPEREQCRRGAEPQLRVVREPGEASERLVERGRRCAGDRSVDGKVDLAELVQCLGGDRSPGRRVGLDHLGEPFRRRDPRAAVGRVAHAGIVPRAVAHNRRSDFRQPSERAAGE